jgi:hypothetical protein
MIGATVRAYIRSAGRTTPSRRTGALTDLAFVDVLCLEDLEQS